LETVAAPVSAIAAGSITHPAVNASNSRTRSVPALGGRSFHQKARYSASLSINSIEAISSLASSKHLKPVQPVGRSSQYWSR
jgi:hypothetical protein